MKRRLLLLISSALLLFGAVASWIASSYEAPAEAAKESKGERIADALAQDFERTKDLELGYPPTERLVDAFHQTVRRQQELAGTLDRGTIANPKFRERGPNNIGGRTRTILIDRNDPTGETVWAGGVSGGLWKTTNISAADPQWQKVDDFMQNLSIGHMAQDPNNPQVMYLGTGEGPTGIRGLGIFKTTDGGDTWDLLTSTLGGNFYFCNELFVHPVNGEVYSATTSGLYRSQNGGASWQKVLGAGLGASTDVMYDIAYASNGYILASSSNTLFRSTTGNPGSWEQITKSPVPSGMTRMEFSVCKQDPNIIYILGNLGGASNLYATVNGGQTWLVRAQPQNNNGSEFTNGQAWYDLEVTIDPFDCEHVIAGGVPLRSSSSGGFFWEPYGGGIHVDQHTVVFDEEVQGRIFHGNDGGVYQAQIELTSQTFSDKNQGYNVTQFYACALHPDAYSNYMLGGTQDNNSLQLDEFGIAPARSVWGGDGAFCHIDQNEPNIQLVSSQTANYGLSLDGGGNFAFGNDFNGSFISPSDYDNDANILYSQTGDGAFYRWSINTGAVDLVNIEGPGVPTNFNVTAIAVDPNVPNRIYLGTAGTSRIMRIDNAHTGDVVTAEVLAVFAGSCASIEVAPGDPDRILVTYSNYGLANNIFLSTDGGDTWAGCEGNDVLNNLPDMPVRWGIFNPDNHEQAMIATQLGVWTTEKLDGNNTVWIPPMPGRGTPLVRTDMLQYRMSDKIVLAATYGRGMFTTDVFADPTARLGETPQVHYVHSPLLFQGQYSLNADDYFWDFGDGTTSTEENVFHEYDELGTYQVSLTINGGQSSAEAPLKILPERPSPYQPGTAEYSGDFEGFDEHFGVHTFEGSSWERGQSNIVGKEGTVSGENVYVVGKDESSVLPNTHTVLYLPNFDLREAGIYEFSFYGKFDLDTGTDGFRVEYSKDGGQSWEILGNGVTQNWYNTFNGVLVNGAFPLNTYFFSKRVSQWTQFKLNISNLSGDSFVAFRFVCKADDVGISPGVAIDDVTITRYEGELVTRLQSFTGEFSGSTEVTLNWATQPEYFAKRFEIERSLNGKDFELVETVNATGGSTQIQQNYDYSEQAFLNLYFYRIKVISENVAADYYQEFYSPIVVVRRNTFEGVEVFKVFPNPFDTYVDMTFTEAVSDTLAYELYDASGKLLIKGQEAAEGITYFRIDMPPLAAGVYFLRLQIGEGQQETIRLLRI